MMKKKTAVYCRTIEEYNIVAKHYNRKIKEYFTSHGWNCIHTDNPSDSHSLKCDSLYDDIPFNEWILTEMPKAGDKVIIIKSDRRWAKLMDKYVDKIVTVTSTTETYIKFDDFSAWVWNFSKGHFRIATPEEISNYEKSKQPEDKYVKITNNGYMYTTHSKAKEYGCTNYTYYNNLPNGTVCKVIANPYINNDCDGYALEYDNKHYLIAQSGTTASTKEEYDAQFKIKDSCLFVKGQWYKGNCDRYMKFSHLENRGSYNALYYTERIYDGKYQLIDNYWANDDMEKHALEYPLEKVMDEIQPFLPEEHPDKIKPVKNDYIVGAWYKSNNLRVKFLKLEGNKFYISICINPYNGYVDDTEGYIPLNEPPFPELMTDLDEIQPFLPEGHEDKVVKNSPKEPVYIAGKWYKMNNCWYAKCSNSSFNKEMFYGNEWYDSNGEYDDREFTATLEEQNSIVELTESTIDDKTPIKLKAIICGDMKDDKKTEPKYPEPKYKVGDELESCEGGWQYSETGFEMQNATSFAGSCENAIKGKCTKVEWSNTHQIWWYKIGNYGNMFTESGVKLIDKMKSIEPEYSKYTIKLNSQEEYRQCLDYFKNILKISNIQYALGFTPQWDKFKYDESRKLWRLHGYDDTVENVVSLQDFINNIAKIPYKAIPKFSKGDKVKVCSSEEDIDKNGFMYPTGRIYQIVGAAGSIRILTGEIKEKNGDIYYGCEKPFDGCIKESCLSLVENETILKDSFVNYTDEDEITEYKGLKEEDYSQKTLNLLKKQITII